LQVEIVSGLAPLHNAYSMKECEPPLTTKTATFAGNLDYIWVCVMKHEATRSCVATAASVMFCDAPGVD